VSQITIDRFYNAFARADGLTMALCYHPMVSFADPLFPDLRGAHAAMLWPMLMSDAVLGMSQIELTYEIMAADERKAQIKWEAKYRQRKRQVRQQALSTLTFWDDKIVRQIDEFPFWAWARQARGMSGLLLGGLPPYQRFQQARAHSELEAFMRSR
jgi:ketosteroid isomerase-like protein